MVNNLPEMQETRIQPLGLEDLLEKGMPTHCNILTWRIPWTEDLPLKYVIKTSLYLFPQRSKAFTSKDLNHRIQ